MASAWDGKAHPIRMQEATTAAVGPATRPHTDAVAPVRRILAAAKASAKREGLDHAS